MRRGIFAAESKLNEYCSRREHSVILTDVTEGSLSAALDLVGRGTTLIRFRKKQGLLSSRKAVLSSGLEGTPIQLILLKKPLKSSTLFSSILCRAGDVPVVCGQETDQIGPLELLDGPRLGLLEGLAL